MQYGERKVWNIQWTYQSHYHSIFFMIWFVIIKKGENVRTISFDDVKYTFDYSEQKVYMYMKSPLRMLSCSFPFDDLINKWDLNDYIMNQVITYTIMEVTKMKEKFKWSINHQLMSHNAYTTCLGDFWWFYMYTNVFDWLQTPMIDYWSQ